MYKKSLSSLNLQLVTDLRVDDPAAILGLLDIFDIVSNVFCFPYVLIFNSFIFLSKG